MQETAAPTEGLTRPARRAPLWTAGATALVGIPTVVIDIYSWTGQASAMPFSVHHILVISAACFASMTLLLLFLGRLFDWLDRRQAERAESARKREDDRVDALINAVSGRMYATEAELVEIKKLLEPRAEQRRLQEYEAKFVDRLHNGANGATVHHLPSTS